MGNGMMASGNNASQPVETVVELDLEMKWAKAVAGYKDEQGRIVNASSIIPDSYKGEPGSVLVAVGLGRSMGLNMAQSLSRINVIKGKPTASGELIASQVRKAGHKLRIRKDEKNMSVTATIVRADDPDFEFSVTRDMQWAKRMGLDGRDNYRKQPMTMLMWRAVSAVAREACPEALYGVAYTPEEIKDSVEDDDVEYTVEDTESSDTMDRLKQVSDILKEGGALSADDLRLVLSEFTGRDVSTIEELKPDEIDNLLDSEQLTLERVKSTLAHVEKAKVDAETPTISYTLKDVEEGFAHIGCSLKDAQPAIEKVVGHKVPDPHKLTPAEIDKIMYDLNHSEVKQ